MLNLKLTSQTTTISNAFQVQVIIIIILIISEVTTTHNNRIKQGQHIHFVVCDCDYILIGLSQLYASMNNKIIIIDGM